ncbi:MAG: putative toxin-antitoxin system toxin component, PIN family [Saprospiraceae bacterium]|nr:putative toxin-antitoxin system toxin component, PIN family [Saprospiraceae bacterium]
MRVVLDTNVLLVAISRKTPYFSIFNSLMNGEYELCVTTDILNEYAEKLSQRFSEEAMYNLMKAIEKSPDILHVIKYFFWNLITADPDDNKFVDCAVAASADFIVTEDKHFKVLKDIPFPPVTVISMDDFVEMLTGMRPETSEHRKP